MWRTVIVTKGEKLTIKDNWLVVYSDNNEQRVPVSLNLPMNTHYKPFGVMKKQLAMSEELTGHLWQKIVKQKIKNQMICVSSLTSAIEKNNEDLLILPELIPIETNFEDDEDG